MRALREERAALDRVLKLYLPVAKELEDLAVLAELAAEGHDAGLLAERERARATAREHLAALERLAYWAGPHDAQPAILTIAAGAGGTEAQDWAQLLLRMYLRYGERQSWASEVLDESPGQEAGYKHVTVRFAGAFPYGRLKREAGVHRLVRQSPFNADHLRQTSFALVDVIPELPEGAVRVDPADVAFEAFRSSGRGGQNVQKVSTAVRLRHRPTGIVVTCQTERSQAQNRARAETLLLSKLEHLRELQHAATIADLRGKIPEAAWGQQIRSYVLHPYKLVKDHRTGAETTDAIGVLDGKLDPFVEAGLKGNKGG